jgi:sialidase-1
MPINRTKFVSNDNAYWGDKLVRAMMVVAVAITLVRQMPAEEPGTLGVLTAVSSRPVHPMLIRNEHGPLTRVVVVAEQGAEARAAAFVFRLDGTDDLDDIESLALYSTGNKDEFSPSTSIGQRAKPAKEVTFRGEQTLGAGKNVFWLSCRLKPTADLSHKVAATCSSIETSIGMLRPRDDSLFVRHRIGVALRRHKDDGVHTYRIPALTTSAKGTLLCVYDMRRRMGRDLQEDIDIGLSRSTDGGRTWEPVRVIMDMGEFGGLPQEQNGCSDPGIIVDHQTGEIFCFAVWMNGKPGKHQWTDDGSEPGFEIGKSAQFMMVRSKDDGLTWSKPENLTRKLKQASWWLLAPSPQQGIQLPDGTLVMPVEGRDGRAALSSFATIMISRDHGTTWTVGKPAFGGGNECQAVQLGDGSLMLNMRNDHERFRAVFVTKDLGQTWQPHETNRNTLIEPNCNGSLLRFDYEHAGEKKHVLLFANPHTQQGRTHHTIQVSFDDGRTWPKSHHLLLDEGRGAGYPSLTRVDDSHVGIVYEGSQSHLVFEKFSLDELLRL